MRLVETFGANRKLQVLGLLGLLTLASGCDSGTATNAPQVPTSESKAKEDSERDARTKAYGKTAIPTKEAPKQ